MQAGMRTTNVPYKPKVYKDLTSITLPLDEINSLLHRRVMEFYDRTKKIFPQFDSFPVPAKLALIDMTFNLGIEKFNKAFVRLQVAVRLQNWTLAAAECHRKGPAEPRNISTRQLFLDAAALANNQISRAGGNRP